MKQIQRRQWLILVTINIEFLFILSVVFLECSYSTMQCKRITGHCRKIPGHFHHYSSNINYVTHKDFGIIWPYTYTKYSNMEEQQLLHFKRMLLTITKTKTLTLFLYQNSRTNNQWLLCTKTMWFICWNLSVFAHTSMP